MSVCPSRFSCKDDNLKTMCPIDFKFCTRLHEAIMSPGIAFQTDWCQIEAIVAIVCMVPASIAGCCCE